jgi:hypothetical protein
MVAQRTLGNETTNHIFTPKGLHNDVPRSLCNPFGQRRERFLATKKRGLQDLGNKTKGQTPTATTEDASVVLGVWQYGKAKGFAEKGEAEERTAP